MNITDIFKTPAIPAGGSNKRKLPEHPDDRYSKEARHDTYEELTGRASGLNDTADDSEASRRDTQNADDSAFGDAEDEDGGRFFGDGLTDDMRHILELVDAAEQTETETLDVPGVKRMLLKFEKALSKNTQLRVKNADDPSKFMESEAELDEEIKNLMSLTQAPQHYPTIVQLGSDASIVSLLGHENTDIAVGAVELLNELTDEDVLPEDDEGEKAVRIFVDSLIKQQVLELLVQNIARLDETIPDDRQGVFNTLGVIENLTSFNPELSETVVNRTGLMEWLIKRIQNKVFDSNKQYASELLSILVQNSRANRLKVVKLGGMDVLLQVLSPYRRKDPKDDEENEFMENIFDALCSSVAEPEIKEELVKAEGIELMLIMLKEKNSSCMRSLRVLDFACTTPAGTTCCERLVDALGLKTLFAAFMGKGERKVKKRYKAFSESEQEEHLIGIISSLLKNLSANSERRDRLLAKFTENGHEKIDRLLELAERLEAKVEAADQHLAERRAEREEDDEDEEEEIDPEEEYLTRLEAGLFALQVVNLILAAVILEVDSARDHAHMLLSRRNKSFADVKAVLIEYLKNLGDEADATPSDADTPVENKTSSEKSRVEKLIAGLS